MKRHQQILAGVLVLQIILSAVLLWPREVATGIGAYLIDGLEVEDIVGLSITDDQGESLELRRSESGWVLASAGDYPVREGQVEPVLAKLAGLRTAELVARSEASQRQLQVSADAFVRRIRIDTVDGDSYVVYLGSAPRYTATHVRLAGQVETYLTLDLSSWELNTRASSWVDVIYGQIEQDKIAEMVLENPQGTFRFVREEGQWTLADRQPDEEVNADAIASVVRNASSVTLQQPLGKTLDPAYGMDAPRARVTFVLDDGATETLWVGSQSVRDSSYVVKSSTSDYYVRVAAYTVAPLVERAREDFLRPVETDADPGP